MYWSAPLAVQDTKLIIINIFPAGVFSGVENFPVIVGSFELRGLPWILSAPWIILHSQATKKQLSETAPQLCTRPKFSEFELTSQALKTEWQKAIH